MTFSRIKDEILNIIFRIFPLRKAIMFYNILDGYSDNPKYISEYVHNIRPDITQIWVYTKEQTFSMYPDYLVLVKRYSPKYWYWKNCCKVLIDNSVGVKYTSSEFLKKFLIRKKQINYSTWHGVPIKKIGVDYNLFTPNSTFYTSSNCVYLGYQYEIDTLSSAYVYSLNVKLLGTPRVDCLFNKNMQSTNRVRERYGIGSSRIIIFAPTYREPEYSCSVLDILSQFNISRLIKTVRERFGGEWIFAYRLHHNDIGFASVLKETIDEENILFNGNIIPDMNELLSISDVLITDYSSCMFDFLHTGKPCFMYMPDYKEYSIERGLYLEPSQMPYPVSFSFDELICDIQDYKDRNEDISFFLKSIGNVNDGTAVSSLCNLFLNKL